MNHLIFISNIETLAIGKNTIKKVDNEKDVNGNMEAYYNNNGWLKFAFHFWIYAMWAYNFYFLLDKQMLLHALL